MKTIAVSMILAGLLAPATALAQAPDDPQPRRAAGERGGQRPFAQAWQMADKDRDGFISREEFAAMPRVQNLPEDKRDKLFKRLDKDGDGRLSRGELRKPGNPPPGGPPPEPMQRLWELDTDRSGGVSLEEFRAGPLAEKLPPERIQKIFQRLDRDGDGQITPKDRPEPPRRGREGPRRGERPEGPPPPQPDPMRLFRQLDKNDAKTLSFREFRQHPAVKNLDEDAQEARFQRLDRNQDGKLTPEELRPLQPPRGQRRPGPDSPPEAPPMEE